MATAPQSIDWNEIVVDPSFQAQPPDVKNQVAEKYFNTYIASDPTFHAQAPAVKQAVIEKMQSSMIKRVDRTMMESGFSPHDPGMVPAEKLPRDTSDDTEWPSPLNIAKHGLAGLEHGVGTIASKVHNYYNPTDRIIDPLNIQRADIGKNIQQSAAELARSATTGKEGFLAKTGNQVAEVGGEMAPALAAMTLVPESAPGWVGPAALGGMGALQAEPGQELKAAATNAAFGMAGKAIAPLSKALGTISPKLGGELGPAMQRGAGATMMGSLPLFQGLQGGAQGLRDAGPQILAQSLIGAAMPVGARQAEAPPASALPEWLNTSKAPASSPVPPERPGDEIQFNPPQGPPKLPIVAPETPDEGIQFRLPPVQADLTTGPDQFVQPPMAQPRTQAPLNPDAPIPFPQTMRTSQLPVWYPDVPLGATEPIAPMSRPGRNFPAPPNMHTPFSLDQPPAPQGQPSLPFKQWYPDVPAIYQEGPPEPNFPRPAPIAPPKIRLAVQAAPETQLQPQGKSQPQMPAPTIAPPKVKLVNSSGSERGLDIGSGGTNDLSNIIKGPSRSSEINSQGEIPSGGFMAQGMRLGTQNNEVGESIVPPVSIDVVDMLGEQKRAPQMLFHDEAMLQNPALSNTSMDIIPPIINREMAIEALPVAKVRFRLPSLRGGFQDNLSAKPAHDLSPTVIRPFDSGLEISTHNQIPLPESYETGSLNSSNKLNPIEIQRGFQPNEPQAENRGAISQEESQGRSGPDGQPNLEPQVQQQSGGEPASNRGSEPQRAAEPPQAGSDVLGLDNGLYLQSFPGAMFPLAKKAYRTVVGTRELPSLSEVRQKLSDINDEFARYGGKMFPALGDEGKRNATVGASTLVSAPEYSKYREAEWVANLKDIADKYKAPWDSFKRVLGSVITEDQLRGVRNKFIAAMDPKAGSVTDIYSHADSPLKNDAHYQAALAHPGVQEAIQYLRDHVAPELTGYYESSSKLGSGNAPPPRGVDTGIHMSLAPDIPDEVQGATKLKIGGGLKNSLDKHALTERAAQGSGTYKLGIDDILHDALQRSLLPGLDAQFKEGMIKDDWAQRGKPGAKNEPAPVDGHGWKSFPTEFRSRTFVKEDSPNFTKNENEVLWVRDDKADEYRRALDYDKQHSLVGKIGDVATKIQLASLQEATTHIVNNAAQMALKPLDAGGAGKTLGKVGAVAENLPVAKVAGILDNVVTNVAKLMSGDKTTMAKMAELAKIGALPPDWNSVNSTGLIGKVILGPYAVSRTVRTLTDAMRLSIADGYDMLVRQGIMPDDPATKRDWINQSGQYHKEAQAMLVAAARSTGLGPFATAGSAKAASAARVLKGLSPGVETTSAKSNAALRVYAAAQIGGVLATAGILNNLRTGSMLPPGIPVGAIFLYNDAEGKPHYFDPLKWTPVRPAMRITGLEAFINAKREGYTMGGAIDKAGTQAVTTLASPYVGPVPSALIEEMGGFNPHGGYTLAPDTGPLKFRANTRETFKGINPTIHNMVDPKNDIGLWGQLGQLAPQTGLSPADLARIAKSQRSDKTGDSDPLGPLFSEPEKKGPRTRKTVIPGVQGVPKLPRFVPGR